jgi:hypothetical protein
MSPSHRLRALACALAVALAAAPVLAYTIVLKDGSRIVAKSKYTIQGDLALITLPSGTQSAYPASEIDVDKTEQMNRQDLGTAIVIEGGKVKPLDTSAAPPKKSSLQDLIQKRPSGLPEPPETVQTRAPVGSERRLRPGPSGRSPMRDPNLANEIKAFLITRGVAADVYEGAGPRRILLVFETSAEGPVFKALVASATALLQIRQQFPDRVDVFEVICEVPDTAGLGGRFTLTPTQAADLISGRIDLTRFYVENVEF